LYSIAIQRRKRKTEKPNAIHPPPVEVGDFWLIYVKKRETGAATPIPPLLTTK